MESRRIVQMEKNDVGMVRVWVTGVQKEQKSHKQIREEK